MNCNFPGSDLGSNHDVPSTPLLEDTVTNRPTSKSYQPTAIKLEAVTTQNETDSIREHLADKTADPFSLKNELVQPIGHVKQLRPAVSSSAKTETLLQNESEMMRPNKTGNRQDFNVSRTVEYSAWNEEIDGPSDSHQKGSKTNVVTPKNIKTESSAYSPYNESAVWSTSSDSCGSTWTGETDLKNSPKIPVKV